MKRGAPVRGLERLDDAVHHLKLPGPGRLVEQRNDVQALVAAALVAAMEH